MNAGADPARNLDWIERRCRALPEGVGLLALPEVFAVRGPPQALRAAAEWLPGPMTRRLMALAASRRIWILAGSLVERGRGGRLYNTSLLLDRRGRLAARYRKLHLFEARLDDGRRIRERDTYTPGSRPVLAEIEGWRCGLAICYDLRFPALFAGYARQGADLLFAPSDFTRATGRAHWETLVRARAIETQAFVVAPNQCGRHPAGGAASYGHSLVVGPWGSVLARAGDRPRLLTVTLDPGQLRRARARLPGLRTRSAPHA